MLMMAMPRTIRTRHGMALRADLAGAFLLPADLNFAMKIDRAEAPLYRVPPAAACSRILAVTSLRKSIGFFRSDSLATIWSPNSR